ncbi:hypothetical protein LK994_00240 [Ferruginibacter lapsinanis]|uniref:hypothetical protein n=1 Tax=Ferruginibacter lapsinanis TaxID=563172 RepID=UPI001E628B7F|nr:hypothetical protein [Ferruginibacter lapsinanis]UEG49899.1 hypothetical protein LK994_00240 [Ferruginibacter lapsinanis]
MTVTVFVLDWLKATYFLHKYHALFVIIRTVFLPITGIVVMKYSVTGKMFRIFLLVYLLLWGGYFLSKLIILGLGHFHLATISPEAAINFTRDYLVFTKLLTPFPFIFFWMVDRIFYQQQKKQS